MAIGTLEVKLVNAKGLRGTDFLGGIDPYVVIQYKGQERKSSVARGEGGSPVWNETFTFRAEYPGSGDDFKLVLKIMDHDNFSADDFIGQTSLAEFVIFSASPLAGTHFLSNRCENSNPTFFGASVLAVKPFSSGIYVEDLLALGAENGVSELRAQKYSVVGGDLNYSGEIQVGVSFTQKETQYDGEEVGGWQESEY